MTAERWEQVKQIYDSALKREASERAAYLDQACAGDEALRREVESLLVYEHRAEDFIKTPALQVAARVLAQEPSASLIRRQLGHYQVLSRLGAGGMGEVYLAEDSRLGRKVALKLLPAEFTQDAERVRRFEREARAASALNHPNIVTIHEIGQVDDLHYIVTEYIEGQTLRHVLSTPLDLPAALDIAVQAASALSAAHEVGIVHRDIKPENLMLRPDGYIKVLDFGLAKLTELQTPAPGNEAPTVADSETEAGVVMGTVGYMSPEQVRGQRVDARTDIFSLGVVLYEMLAGRAPFAGATKADVLATVLQTEPLPLTQHSRAVPETLGWIVAKALRKERAERYQTARDLLVDLKRLKQELELEASLKRAGELALNREAALDRADRQASAKAANQPQPDAYETKRVKPQVQRRSSRKAIDSLAILPLLNTSADPNSEYLSDGITESIIAAVSGLPKLRVMAWSTVSRYKRERVAPQEIGQALGVRAVLTGRIVQLSDRLVIKTELVDTSDGSHLWGEHYNFNPSDVFAVEAEIAKEISEQLLLRLTGAEKRQLAKRATDNTQAYHAYLRGRYYWNKRTDENVRKAIEYFKQAIDCDPCYALAYAGLADAYVILGAFGVATLPPGEAYPKAKEAATKALEIDETLAEAHASLAFSLAQYDWDWSAAEREFKRALELKPGYAVAHHWYGFIYLVARGALDEAIAEVKRAHELDPLSLTISSNLGLLLYLARRYDQAIEQYQHTLEMERHFAYTHWQLALAYEQKALYEEAIAELQKAIALSGRSLQPLAQLGHAYAVAGKRDQALAVLAELNELAQQNYVSPSRTAAIYVGLGQIEQAFEWLERAYHERDSWLIWLKFDPVMDELRTDRRFTSLLERIGLANDVAPTAKPLVGATQAVRSASSKRRSRKAINSLAILPLVNSSHDPNMEYLSEGITESIINNLSQLPKLKVMARSTVFRYKGQAVSPQQVGRELDVCAVLAGGVLQLDDNLVISTELINVADGTQLWGEQYKRKLSDIFAVQEEIAQEITEKLRLKLTGEEKRRLARRHTQNTAAYQVYLKGRYYWNKRDVASLKKAVEHFRQAIELDPSYAAAYSGLSDCYTLLVVREALAPEEGFAKAKAAAGRALQIDEAFAEAHASLGHALLHNWEWADAERELRRAIELNPGYPSAHHWYSEHLTALGRCEESIAELKLAGELDPLSLVISADLGRAFYYARAYDQVLEQEAKTLEMEPNFWLSHINLGRAYTQKGLQAEALARLQKARELSAGNTEVLSFLGFAHAAAGMRDEAVELLRALDEQAQRGYVPPYHFAIVHAGLGEKERAFEWLEHAFEKRAVDLFTLKVEPMFDGLRADPRFTDLLRRVGLAP
jgi:eukaryotic-like serine/threonine-protein kinase